MAKITRDPRRPGKLLITGSDAFGRRHRPSFPDTPEGRREAQRELAIIETQSKRPCMVDPEITVSKYILHCDAVWTAEARSGLRAPGTPHAYNTLLVMHVEPLLGRFKVRAIHRQMVEKLLLEKGKVYSHAHVGNILAVISALLTQAQNDGIVLVNPLFRMGKKVKGLWTAERETRAMEREERDRFLDDARVHEPRFFPAFSTLVFAGLRMGELRGLQRDDIRRSEIRVERQVYARVNRIHPGKMVGPPKGSRPGKVKRRVVDLAEQLVPILHSLVTRGGESRWLFFDSEPDLETAQSFTNALGHAMERILERIGLADRRFTPHSLRHTCACLIITQSKVQTGDLLLFLAQMLGHDTTGETEKTYAHWLKQRNRAAVTAGAERAEEDTADMPLSATILPFKK